MTPLRLPDFVIIGAMKAGTTTLFRWLESHPGTSMPTVKEPHFFSVDEKYSKGLAFYAEHFRQAPPGLLTGEASVTYSDPELPQAGVRLISDLPNARLIFLTRDPEQRLRSHYLHELRRSREKRTFLDAVTPGVFMSSAARTSPAFVPTSIRRRTGFWSWTWKTSSDQATRPGVPCRVISACQPWPVRSGE